MSATIICLHGPRCLRSMAERVYDANTGSLCMVARRAINSGLSDSEGHGDRAVRSALDGEAREHAVGMISSLRKKSDPLLLEALESNKVANTKVHNVKFRIDPSSCPPLQRSSVHNRS